MKTIVLIGAVILMGGCATTDGNSYMPSEAQLQARNPYLLNCPRNKPPVCKVWGGRVNNEAAMCACSK